MVEAVDADMWALLGSDAGLDLGHGFNGWEATVLSKGCWDDLKCVGESANGILV